MSLIKLNARLQNVVNGANLQQDTKTKKKTTFGSRFKLKRNRSIKHGLKGDIPDVAKVEEKEEQVDVTASLNGSQKQGDV